MRSASKMIRAKKILDLDKKITDGTVVIASDIHIPFQDKAAVKAFLSYVKGKQPEIIVLNGDVLDMFMLSRFTKGEGRNPLEEIKMCQALLATLRSTCPNSEIFYVIGNHETRLEKYVLNKAPELASLIEDVFSIIKVEDYNVRGCASLTINDNFVMKHGTYIGNKSGLSAIKEMENAYMSGATGHVHRLSTYRARKAGRKFVWIETGCLCDLNPEYCVNPNWCQGFAVVEFKDGKLYKADCLEIEKGKIL